MSLSMAVISTTARSSKSKASCTLALERVCIKISLIEMSSFVNNRIEYFDTVRFFAVYWIVCISHLSSYMEESFRELMTPPMFDITRHSLAVMMFISGYLLSKYRSITKKGITFFYKRRFYRFYCLFFLSAFSLYILDFIPDIMIVLTTISGLSSYILPQPSTLWFMSMLMSFYMITPFLNKLIGKISLIPNLIILLFVFLMIILLETKMNIDKRLHWCFSAYLLGLILGRAGLLHLIISNIYLGVGVVVLNIILITNGFTGAYVYDIDIFCGLIGLLFISKWLTFICIKKAFLFFSYTSMSLYLFHRHFYIIERTAYRYFIESVKYLPLWYGLVIMIPTSIIGSFCIQKAYDKLIGYVKI